MAVDRTCDDCRFAVFEDNGYSNYTVEGTEFSCARKLHPDGTFDRFYKVNPKLDHAAICPGFEAGESIDIDVERDNIEQLTPEQKIVWDMHNGIIEMPAREVDALPGPVRLYFARWSQ